MTRSLLSRLPDIFACAAVRSSEAMHTLGLRPGQCFHGLVAANDVSEASKWRFHVSGDMAALLGMLAGQQPFSCMRQELGFLWLSTQPLCEGMDAQQVSPKRDATLLSDFSHRLLLARELLSPSALVAVECTPGLEEGVSLVMQTVFGQQPHWTKLDDRPHAPPVLLCTAGTTDRAWATRCGPRHGKRSSLLHWLSDAPSSGCTALALGPTLDLSDVWRAWRGRWVVTHADPLMLARLELQSADLREA
jgi:hypothetical protein